MTETLQTKPLGLRLPADLHARIKDLADSERRSINGQVIVLLEAGIAATSEGRESP